MPVGETAWYKMCTTEITRILRRFREECSLEHYGLPYKRACRIEEELHLLLYRTQQVTAIELKTLRESIDLHNAVLMNQFARRMAAAAVREKNKDRVVSALTALSLDGDLLDDRDVYRTGALIIDSLVRLGLDAVLMFDRCLTIATESRRALLMHQLKTAPAYMRSLKSMSFGAIESDANFTYVDQLFVLPYRIDERQVNSAIEELLRNEQQEGGKP